MGIHLLGIPKTKEFNIHNKTAGNRNSLVGILKTIH